MQFLNKLTFSASIFFFLKSYLGQYYPSKNYSTTDMDYLIMLFVLILDSKKIFYGLELKMAFQMENGSFSNLDETDGLAT
jgi:hypothetical protein